jgi:hypothetical protein
VGNYMTANPREKALIERAIFDPQRHSDRMSPPATTSVCELQHLPLPVTVSRAASNDPAPSDEESQPIEAQLLPPQDGGTAAWRLLLSAFIFEALLWGFPLSFGVFQNYYTQLPQFKDDSYVSVIGTVASGLTYMAAPIIIPLIKRFARWRRRMVWIGCTSRLAQGCKQE